MTAFDTGLLLFVADELLDRDAGSARKPDRMAQEADADGSRNCQRSSACALRCSRQSLLNHV